MTATYRGSYDSLESIISLVRLNSVHLFDHWKQEHHGMLLISRVAALESMPWKRGTKKRQTFYSRQVSEIGTVWA